MSIERALEWYWSKSNQNGSVDEFRLDPRKSEFTTSFDVWTGADGKIDFEYEWTGLKAGAGPVSSGKKKGTSSYIIESL